MRPPPLFDAPVRLARDVDLGPVRLRVHDWPGGRGPIVCLPGQTASGRAFDGLAEALSPEWRVMALDLRGRGESDAPPHGYGYQVLVADTLALLDQLGFEPVVLVGHAYGALLALLVAAWYPERVRALALVDGGTDIPEHVHRAVDGLISRLDTVYLSVDAYLDPLRQAPWLQPWSEGLEAFFRASVVEVPGGVRARTSKAAIEQEVRAYRDGPPVYPALHAAVRCPTLVVRATGGGLLARDDLVLPDAAYQAMLSRIPDVRGVEVPDASHATVLLGRPERTIAAVREFLAGLGQAVSSDK